MMNRWRKESSLATVSCLMLTLLYKIWREEDKQLFVDTVQHTTLLLVTSKNYNLSNGITLLIIGYV
jgi:hypothetical protein